MTPEQKDQIYATGLAFMNQSQKTVHTYHRAIYEFQRIPGWKDADDLCRYCRTCLAQYQATDRSQQTRKAPPKAGSISAGAVFGIVVVVLICLALVGLLVWNTWISPMLDFQNAQKLEQQGDYAGAALAYAKLTDNPEAQENAARLWKQLVEYHTYAATEDHSARLLSDGTVSYTDFSGQTLLLPGWTDVVSISLGYQHVVGLKSDGTLLAWGSDSDGQCKVSHVTRAVNVYAAGGTTAALLMDGTVWKSSFSGGYLEDRTDVVELALLGDGTCYTRHANGRVTGPSEIDNWENIVDIWVCKSREGHQYMVGKQADGTVLVSGRYNVSGWTDITAIEATPDQILGLRKDGAVLASDWGIINHYYENVTALSSNHLEPGFIFADGTMEARVNYHANDENGITEFYYSYGSPDWHGITALSMGPEHIVGLREDGTAVAFGTDLAGQCQVRSWKDLVSVSAGDCHTVGLRSDGTAVSTVVRDYSRNIDGEPLRYDCTSDQDAVSEWTGLTDLQAGHYHTVGLRADGTVLATGSNYYGQCNVSNWRNIVAIDAGPFYTAGLCADGTVMTVGEFSFQTSGWTDVVAISAGNDYLVGLRADGTVVVAAPELEALQ